MSALRARRVRTRATQPGFPGPIVEALDKARILGVRSGGEHRYTGVWVVVVEARVFVRSWNDKPAGWYRAFRDQPRGSIQVGKREVAIRAVPTRSERLRHAVSAAYADKYTTRASQKWVTGFAEARRTLTTLELVPGYSDRRTVAGSTRAARRAGT